MDYLILIGIGEKNIEKSSKNSMICLADVTEEKH